MSHKYQAKGKLPACAIDVEFMNSLWRIVTNGDEIAWEAKVGTCSDILGKEDNRPVQTIQDWDELISTLETLPRIDSLLLTFEVLNKGTVAIAYKNYTPAGGSLIVSSDDEVWADEMFDKVAGLFNSRKEDFITGLHCRIGYACLHSVIPLTVSFVLVTVLARLLIPADILKVWVWWITAGTILITLKLASVISDRLLIGSLKKYPYIRWLS